MITLFSGFLGTGKSYRMVSELSRRKGDYYVIHNIDGLQPGYLGDYGFDWVERCRSEGIEAESFFSRDYQKQLCDAVLEKYNRRVLVIIDEASEWFSKVNKDLKLWLQNSRRLGQDVWLMSHRASNLSTVYRSYIEVEYRAKGGAFLGLPGVFAYNRILGGQRAGYDFEKKRKEIFALYKSQIVGQPGVQKKSMMIPVMVLVVVFCVGLFFYLPGRWGSRSATAKDLPKKETVLSEKTVRPSGSDGAGGQKEVSAGLPSATKSDALSLADRLVVITEN